MGFSDTQSTLVYTLYNLLYALLSYPLGSLGDRIGVGRLVSLGFAIYALVYLGFGLSSAPWQGVALFLLYALYSAAFEGGSWAYLARVIPATEKVSAIGLYTTLVGVLLLPSSLLFGWLWSRFSPGVAFFRGRPSLSWPCSCSPSGPKPHPRGNGPVTGCDQTKMARTLLPSLRTGRKGASYSVLEVQRRNRAANRRFGGGKRGFRPSPAGRVVQPGLWRRAAGVAFQGAGRGRGLRTHSNWLLHLWAHNEAYLAGLRVHESDYCMAEDPVPAEVPEHPEESPR